jgi:Na+-transporting methylmalonyl-CoA/oxaloacetate decarboxylase gamma subunit
MHIIPILASTAAAAPEQAQASMSDTLPHLLGMVLVVLTLIVLWGVCVLSAILVKKFAPAPAAPAPLKRPAPAATGPTPEIVAVITAAVASVTGSSHRIVSIKHQSSNWGKAGRQSVLSSHKIR